MVSIGETVSPSLLLLAQCEEFVYHMYGKHELQSVDEARYLFIYLFALHICSKGCSPHQQQMSYSCL